MLLTRAPTSSVIHKDYPEFFAYRDIAFWWKWFLNPDMTAFPNSPLAMARWAKPPTYLLRALH